MALACPCPSEFEFLHPLSFVAIAKTETKMKTYPDKKFIQDVCWCCLATGELIILHITFERTMTKQVIECMTNLQVFDPRSWL